MRLIKKFVLVLSAIIGGSAGVILLALVNALGNIGLSFGHVFIYGLAGGIAFAWLIVVIAFFMIRKWIRKKVNYHATRIFSWGNNRLNRFR